MTAAPVPFPVIPVLAERGGTQLQTPRPTVVVDTREQNPFNFSRFKGWFAGIEKKALTLADYSISGLEEVCVVERKDLSDLVHSCTVNRSVFVKRLRLMARYPHRLLGGHQHSEPGEISLRSFQHRSQPRDSIPDRHACRSASPIRLQRNP